MWSMPCLEEIEENDARKRARLLDSLSRSFPSSALSKVLHMACDENLDPLSSSCFADIHLEKFQSRGEVDEELTSLAWLQDANLLRNIAPNNKRASPQPKCDSSDLATLPDVEYDAVLHRKHKPPYSFSCLIFMAIEASQTKCLPVKGIYDWIVQTFPFFHSAPTGWRNSVRHNLSLNKCFRKVDRDYRSGLGKGSSWCIDPIHRPNLLQALRRTPYHPFQQLQMTSSVAVTAKNTDGYSDNEAKESRDKLEPPALDAQANTAKEAKQIRGVNRQHCKRQSAFADIGKNREKIMQDMRLCNDSGHLVCTAYPNEDHIYSIPGLALEEARAVMDSTSAEEDLDLGSELEKDYDFGAYDVEPESSGKSLTEEPEKISISRNKNHVKKIASRRRSKIAASHESKKTKCVDSDESDEQKRLYFTSLALLELAAGKQPILFENKVQEEVLKKKRSSRKTLESAYQPCTRVSTRGRKVSVALHKGASTNGNEPAITSDKEGKRKRKQLLPINSSLWGKRRKLPVDDVNLEYLQKKASSKKVLPITRKQKIVRYRKK